MNQRPSVFDEETGNRIFLPVVWEICWQCSGDGKSSAYLGAFTASEWYEQDEDFHHDYMSGAYDRTCDECNGRGSVQIVDEKKCPPALLEEYFADQQMEADFEAERRAERAGGC